MAAFSENQGPSASSTPDVATGPDQETAKPDVLKTPGSPSSASTQGAGNGSLYLQNAHYGTLEFSTKGTGSGNSQTHEDGGSAKGPSDIALSNTTVAENAAGAVVGTLTTVDAYAGGTHSYSVSDNRFEVAGGQLKLKNGVALDYESAPSVTVTVTSKDAAGASVSETFTLTVGNVAETNIVNGTNNNDTLLGSAGDDLINALSGNDTVNAGDGTDTIVGGAGNDTLNGGEGSDTYQVGAGAGFDRFTDTGTGGNDRILATAGGIAIGIQSGFGPASGIEEIGANGHASVTIAGGTSHDTLNFSSTILTGIDKIDGGGGDDTITGSSGKIGRAHV